MIVFHPLEPKHIWTFINFRFSWSILTIFYALNHVRSDRNSEYSMLVNMTINAFNVFIICLSLWLISNSVHPKCSSSEYSHHFIWTTSEKIEDITKNYRSLTFINDLIPGTSFKDSNFEQTFWFLSQNCWPVILLLVLTALAEVSRLLQPKSGK